MNDQLANDRTYLAWLRTAIALFGLGFVVSKISLIIDPDHEGVSDAGFYSAIGVLVVLCGAAVIVVGYRQHRQVSELIAARGIEGLPPSRWARTFTAVAAVGAVGLSVLIVVTT